MRLLTALLLALIVSHSAAQEVDAWSMLTPTECRFAGEFNQQKSLQGLGPTLNSNGVFFYDCELGIIWKTLSPITESLVLNHSGDSYLVKRLKIEAMQSSQSKKISDLIMALISADKEYLLTLFDASIINQPDAPTTLVLKPKKSTLKRAITSISMSSHEGATITIDMLDPNGQKTRITSKQLTTYADASPTHCATVSKLDERECHLLLSQISNQ